MSSLGSFSGTCLCTGAGSGLGRAAALAFAEAGASLILVDLNLAGLKETQRLVLQQNPAATLHLQQLSVADRPATAAFFASLTELPGLERIDYAINAAGINSGRVHDSIGQDDIEVEAGVYEINLVAMHHWVSLETAHMKANEPLQAASALRSVDRLVANQNFRGAIVNFGSFAAYHGSNSHGGTVPASYTSSKAGVLALTRAAAVAAAPHGIRITAVCPGTFATPMLFKGITPEQLPEFEKGIPARRVGFPHEVADLCLFLCSERATYLAGAVIDIDGGLNAL